VWLDTQSSPSPLETSLVFCWSAASFCVPQWRAPDTEARAVHKGEERGIRSHYLRGSQRRQHRVVARVICSVE
jgi:hypothetical protein